MTRTRMLITSLLTLVLCTTQALATDVGAASNMSAIQGGVTGDGIINFDQNGTLTMNADGTAVSTISVAAGVAAVIQFNATTFTIQYKAGAGAITIGAGGSLTIAGTDTSAGIDYATNNTNATLTVNDSIAGAVNANVLTVGNNTLTVSAAATFAGTVSIGGANATLDNDAATTVATLTMTGALNITPADTMVLTLTNAVSVGANTLTITGSGGGGAEAVNGTITLNSATSQLTTAGADADDVLGDVTVTVSANGAILDANFNTTPVAVNMTAGAGDLTLQVATGKTLTTTIDVNDNTLTISEAGTVSTVQMDTSSGILDVNETMIITTCAPSASVSVDVLTAKALTVTNGLSFVANTLTLLGAGTFSRVDATTGTITDNGGSTITDLRITPAAGTFTWNGTGAGTVTDFLTNSTFATGNIISKAGTGSLAITGGVASYFSTAGTQIINTAAGTLTYGTAGANNAVTFSQDADEITVSSGATLTTYGSFAVGAAAANVNLDAAAGSTVNLSATSAKTFTGVANDDFNLLGTVNINGSATYTISDAFDYKFGAVNISDGCGLANNQPNGEMKFVASSAITLTGNGIFTVDGQASGTRITMDTTSGASTFVLNRGTSSGLTLKNTALARCTYVSSTDYTAQCDAIDLAGSSFDVVDKWEGSCPNSGGSTTPTVVPIEDTVSADGTLMLTTTTDSGSTAEVTIDSALADETVTVTLEDTNTQNTFEGMAGGDTGEGNGIARTLTVDTALEDGTFSAVVQICFTDTDLSSNTLTDEGVGLYVFNDATSQWDLAGSNNLGNSQPTSAVGDYGLFEDGLESGTVCAWAVVDGFSTFAAGELTTYTLDASVATPDNGSVTIDPEQTAYSDGLDVSLTATPATGFEFVSWLINDQDTSVSNPLAITMDADTVAVAQIDKVEIVVEQFTLSAGANEADRGTVDVSPDAPTYEAGTEVTLTATPASGFTFGGWSGNVDSADANANPLTVTVDSDLDITAFFFPEEAVLYTLEVSVDADTAQSGTVAVSPALDSYETGTEITLTATPADGYQFTGWTGDAAGTDNPLVMAISANLSIGATFELAASGDLDETPGDTENVLDTCGTGAGCGAVGTLSMTLTLMGLASLRRSRRRR